MNDPQLEGHMASHIGRRKFLATLGGAVATWPLAARAQQPMAPVIGFMSSRSPEDSQSVLAAFRKGLGHDAAAPPSSVMNSRLLTRSPRRRGRAAAAGR